MSLRFRMFAARFLALLPLALGTARCASAPSVVQPMPVASAAHAHPAHRLQDPLATPPAPGISSDDSFPSIAHSRLDNGLELRVVTRKTYPILELRLVLFSGSASDGSTPGVASVGGALLKAGAGKWGAAELTERAESLGSSIDIYTKVDETRISMAVTSADLNAALDLLGAVAQTPRFDSAEFEKLKQRELERCRTKPPRSKPSPRWQRGRLVLRPRPQPLARRTSHLQSNTDGRGWTLFSATGRELSHFRDSFYSPRAPS